MSKTIGKIGLRIKETESCQDDEILKELSNFASCNLADGLNKFYTLSPKIHEIFPCKLVGRALTVKLRAADNLMLHKAIAMIRPGDVLVVETQGCYQYSVCGELMVSSMKYKGAAGIVVDGTVRDSQDLANIGLPVFAVGTCPSVGDKAGPGEINYPISCGGVVVNPGDYIVGDADGVVVIPKDDVEEVIKGAAKKCASEEVRRVDIAKGDVIRPDVDGILKGLGLEV